LKCFALIDISHSVPLLVINVGKLINKAGMFSVVSFINLRKIFRNLWKGKCSLAHNASICFSFVKSNEIMWGNVNVIQITNRQFFHCHMFVCGWHLKENAVFFFILPVSREKLEICTWHVHEVSTTSVWFSYSPVGNIRSFWKDFDETRNWSV